MATRYTRTTKSGEMVKNVNGGWVLYYEVEPLLKAARRLKMAAENIGGEHVIGLMDLDNAVSLLSTALNDFENNKAP